VIPPDVASALRLQQPDVAKLSADLQKSQPVAPAQRISDALRDLIPGQRIMAEIQALLPNGTYRAVAAQRDLTLALPFSAKAGDTLELEVTESDGKLALAFVANHTKGQAKATLQESVATTLSATGKLIGLLIGDSEVEGKRAAPAALNGSQPLVARMPAVGAELAPVLKQALTQSGMFYEAHQARWVAGQLPTEALRQEPQGKMAPTLPPLPASPPPGQTQATATPEARSSEMTAPATATAVRGEQPAQPATQQGPAIPRELTPIVQQQLDALATQNYAWQGQVWPGQKLWWEIAEDGESAADQDGEAGSRWQTRLKLNLPALGGIEATLRLQPGGRVDIVMTADTDNSEARLREHADALRERFATAGLDLTRLQVEHGETVG
jgi:hypothetical protein